MLNNPSWLTDYQHSVYSQSGEDGIIEKILEIIPGKNGWCVEFGALDGRSMSNTRNLIENKDYSAILIEGSKASYKELCKEFSNNPKVKTLNKFVGFGRNDNLDKLLLETSVPIDFDFLSIDIDGNDYHVWKAIKAYRPKVVCVEFNPTIPTEINFVQPADPKVSQGASLLALVELGKSKAYEIVSVLGVNAFFVRSEYFPLFKIIDNRPEVLRTNLESITHIFFGYDGTVFLRGSQKLPWHCNLQIKEADLQRLPKFLRKYPGNYNWLQLLAFGIYVLFSDRKILVTEIGKLFDRLTKPSKEK